MQLSGVQVTTGRCLGGGGRAVSCRGRSGGRPGAPAHGGARSGSADPLPRSRPGPAGWWPRDNADAGGGPGLLHLGGTCTSQQAPCPLLSPQVPHVLHNRKGLVWLPPCWCPGDSGLDLSTPPPALRPCQQRVLLGILWHHEGPTGDVRRSRRVLRAGIPIGGCARVQVWGPSRVHVLKPE